MHAHLFCHPTFPRCLTSGGQKVREEVCLGFATLLYTPPRGGAALLLFSPKFHFLSEACRPSGESARNATGSCTFFARHEGLAQKVKL